MGMVAWFYAANNNWEMIVAHKNADTFSFGLGYQHLWRCDLIILIKKISKERARIYFFVHGPFIVHKPTIPLYDDVVLPGTSSAQQCLQTRGPF